MSPKFKSRIVRFAIHLAVALVVCFAILILRANDVLQGSEMSLYDALININTPKIDPPSQVVVVGITDDDIQRLHRYPPSDNQLSEALNKLCEMGAAVVAVDIFRDMPVPDNDGASGEANLKATLKQHQQIIWIMEFKKGTQLEIEIQPPQYLSKRPSRIGYADQTIDPDGMIRRAQLVLASNSDAYFSMNFQAAIAYLAQHDTQIDIQPTYATFNQTRIDFLQDNTAGYAHVQTGGDQILLDFKGPQNFEPIRLSDILDGKVRREQIAGKIVMFGYTTGSSVKDQQSIPIRNNSGPTANSPQNAFDKSVDFTKHLRWGIQIQAMMADQIIRIATLGQTPLRFWNTTIESFYILAWGLIATMVIMLWRLSGMRSLGGILGVALGIALGLSLIIGIGCIAFSNGWWIPIIPCVLCYVLTLLLGALVASRFMRTASPQQSSEGLLPSTLPNPGQTP